MTEPQPLCKDCSEKVKERVERLKNELGIIEKSFVAGSYRFIPIYAKIDEVFVPLLQAPLGEGRGFAKSTSTIGALPALFCPKCKRETLIKKETGKGTFCYYCIDCDDQIASGCALQAPVRPGLSAEGEGRVSGMVTPRYTPTRVVTAPALSHSKKLFTNNLWHDAFCIKEDCPCQKRVEKE